MKYRAIDTAVCMCVCCTVKVKGHLGSYPEGEAGHLTGSTVFTIGLCVSETVKQEVTPSLWGRRDGEGVGLLVRMRTGLNTGINN